MFGMCVLIYNAQCYSVHSFVFNGYLNIARYQHKWKNKRCFLYTGGFCHVLVVVVMSTCLHGENAVDENAYLNLVVEQVEQTTYQMLQKSSLSDSMKPVPAISSVWCSLMSSSALGMQITFVLVSGAERSCKKIQSINHLFYHFLIKSHVM